MAKRIQTSVFIKSFVIALIALSITGCLEPVGFQPRITMIPALQILTPSIKGQTGDYLVLGTCYTNDHVLHSDAPGLVLSDNIIVLTESLPQKVYWIQINQGELMSNKAYFVVTTQETISQQPTSQQTDNQIKKTKKVFIGWQGLEKFYNYYELYQQIVETDLGQLTGPFSLTDGEFVYFKSDSIQAFLTDLGNKWEDFHILQNTGDGLLLLIEKK